MYKDGSEWFDTKGRNDMKDFVPNTNIDQMVRDIELAARKTESKLPYDRYGRGNHDTYAYNQTS